MDEARQSAGVSCLTGGGAHIKNQFLHFEFPQQVLNMCKDINQLECVTLVVAIAKWAHMFRCAKLLVNCNNQVTVACINSGFSCNIVLQKCLRYLHKIMALESFEMKTVYLSSQDNRIADNLSRWHLGTQYQRDFWKCVQGWSMSEITVKIDDFQFLF